MNWSASQSPFGNDVHEVTGDNRMDWLSRRVSRLSLKSVSINRPITFSDISVSHLHMEFPNNKLLYIKSIDSGINKFQSCTKNIYFLFLKLRVKYSYKYLWLNIVAVCCKNSQQVYIKTNNLYKEFVFIHEFINFIILIHSIKILFAIMNKNDKRDFFKYLYYFYFIIYAYICYIIYIIIHIFCHYIFYYSLLHKHKIYSNFYIKLYRKKPSQILLYYKFLFLFYRNRDMNRKRS